MRVLVVEDSRSLADVVAEGLRDQGMAVDVAYDGLEAAGKLDINPYDVVVLDRDLPGLHGDTLCRMIADATQLPVLAGPGEATAWGNICVQAITRGRIADLAQARDLIAASVPIISYEPNSTTRDRWDEQYQNFLEAAATSTYGIRPS